MSVRLLPSNESIPGVLSEQFLHAMEDEHHSAFLTAEPLVLGYEDELEMLVRALHGRGFGWLQQAQAIHEPLTPYVELDRELYGQSVYVGPAGVSGIGMVPHWTDHVGIGIQRADANYRLAPGILARDGSQFWLVRGGGETVHTPWTLIAPRNKP